MTAVELDAYRADVARDILTISSRPLLDKIKKLILKEQKAEAKAAAEEEYTPRTHDELVADFKEALNEVKLSLEGKLELRQAEELLNEI